ncbi:MAG: hypothetical protein ABEH65_11660 [Halobacteriales archaeon]
MTPTHDELAGIVDLFGGLTRAQLRDAVEELAFKQGESVEQGDLDDRIDRACRGYYLLAVPAETISDRPDEASPLLVPGPVALPSLPTYGEDLPHIMDPDQQLIPIEAKAAALREQLEADVQAAVEDEATTRAETLLDVCYAAESWGPVEIEDLQRSLQDLLE